MSQKFPATIDCAKVERRSGSRYPEIYRGEVAARSAAALGTLFGLEQFGVNIVTLEAGAWSSHRHAHQTEDEFVYVIDGELILADDAGDHLMTAGMCAGFKAGTGNGHHLKNLSDKPASFLVAGTRANADHVTYSDIDMLAIKDGGPWRFTKKDGSAF